MEPQGPVQSTAVRADFGAYSPPGSTRKRHIRFAAHHDILLLREVIHHNPFWVREFGQVWAAVAERMTSVLQSEGFEVDGRRCRERTALLLDYYKRQNYAMLRRGGTEAMYMEKEDLLQKILELESEKREVGSDPRHRDPRDTMSITITEETLRRAQEEASVPLVTESKQEDNMGERPVRKQECEGCCSAYARILQHLERRAEAEQRLREEELTLRREELQLQRERAALERERQEAERKERERRFELEREERQVILEILREKMIK
ncbi:trichohyalin-like [Bufo bufo]|uniref:trichohyalin-like n=1 Tax=Bufo bufo TaxID=8384 RepID=UPI001ABDD694|nr:trichohyalin-like [Bufo bufo]